MSDLPNPSEIIERIMQTAKSAMPDSLSQDVKQNIRAAIQDVIVDLDVVSREEFDVQSAVLKRTRQKIDEMEQIIAELEQKPGSNK